MRHEVKISAGNSALWGRISSTPQAASNIQSFIATAEEIPEPQSWCCTSTKGTVKKYIIYTQTNN